MKYMFYSPMGSGGSCAEQRALAKVTFVALFVIPTWISSAVSAFDYEGSCYRIRFKNNQCGSVLMSGVSQERCCKSHYRRAWSPSGSSINNTITVEGLPDGEITNQILGKRSTTCIPCYTSCQEIKCDEDQKCVMRHGLPKCVCSPKCHLQLKSAVCGTDGRTYVSECHLLKRSCRKRQRLLVAHSGPCQTCSGVRCGSKKTCVLDELLTPQCAKCPKSCSETMIRKKSICGTDDVTYPSKCALKMASCKAGMTINKAYKGPCKKDADCSNVKCWQDETCLIDAVTNRPRCTYCSDLQNCPSASRFICASDGSTFQSWCAFKHASCRYKKALVVVPLRYCSSNSTKTNTLKNHRNKDCSHKYRQKKKLGEHKDAKSEILKSKLKRKRIMKKTEISATKEIQATSNLVPEVAMQSKDDRRKMKQSRKSKRKKKKSRSEGKQ